MKFFQAQVISQTRRKGACAFLALATALVGGGVAAQAGTTSAGRAQRTCGTVIGAAWSIRGAGSGTRYVVTAEGIACSRALRLVPALTHQRNGGVGARVKGPSDFECKSYVPAHSGEKLVVAGICLRPPGVPFFGWTPKVH